MPQIRTTLTGIRNGCRSVRAKLAKEVELHLKPLRDDAPAEFEKAGNGFAVPYLDRVFDGLRDAVLDGADRATIDLVDTKDDDLSADVAAAVWGCCAGYLAMRGLDCERAWRWHDEARRSGVVTLIVRL